MNIVRSAGRWLLAAATTIMVTAWMGAFLLQGTVLNRDVALRWLDASGIYKDALRSAFRMQDTADTNANIVKTDHLQKALDQTFPPSYVEAQGEKAVHATYDWIEGKTQEINFSIPAQEMRDAFSANLAKILQPEAAKLPVCPIRSNPSTDQPMCIPRGITPAQFATEASKLDSSNNNAFLSSPITAKDIEKSGQIPQFPSLPEIAANVRWMVWALPITALLCAIGYVLLSEPKMRGLGQISRRLFFQGLLSVLGGGVIWYIGRSVDIGGAGDTQQNAIINNIVTPFLQTALPDVSGVLIFAGSLVLLAGSAGWITAAVVQKRNAMAEKRFGGPPSPPTSTPSAPHQPPVPPTTVA